MSNQLVSVITPCFNGEGYIARFLDSILEQTYKNIELIIVDDCSTDKSCEIIESYIPSFLERGYKLVFLRHNENKGQASAINTALPYVKGSYITWPDSDDLFVPEAIEERVDFMEKYQYDFIRTDVSVCCEGSIEKIEYKLSEKNVFVSKNLLRDIVLEKNVYFCPGGYMISYRALTLSIPNKIIYDSRYGQNWQLLIPISENFDCYYLDKVHYKYVVRTNSHSRSNVCDIDKDIKKVDGHQDIVLKTLDRLKVNEKNSGLKEEVNLRFLRKKMYVFGNAGLKFNAYCQFKKIKEKSAYDYIYILSLMLFLKPVLKKVKFILGAKNEIIH
ncbi:glycosyltransferase family 2 protein [Vibrio natriegens]|uniref:glycosyltransferase family 2 protein n=1 Tax=Vibrio natriegens TaxID=691 RepID=UPI003DA0C6B3